MMLQATRVTPRSSPSTKRDDGVSRAIFTSPERRSLAALACWRAAQAEPDGQPSIIRAMAAPSPRAWASSSVAMAPRSALLAERMRASPALTARNTRTASAISASFSERGTGGHDAARGAAVRTWAGRSGRWRVLAAAQLEEPLHRGLLVGEL